MDPQSSQYLLIKRSGEFVTSPAISPLGLSEFAKVARGFNELHWGVDPSPPVFLEQKDGSKKKKKPNEGFELKGYKGFFICYEYFEGVAVHAECKSRVFSVCESIAESLGAKVFPLGEVS